MRWLLGFVKAWRRVLLVLVLLPILFAVGAYLVLWWTSGKELAAAIAETDALDPGWRLEDLDARRLPYPPDGQNACDLVMAARAKWPTGPWPDWQVPVPAGDAEAVTMAQSEMETSLLGRTSQNRLLNDAQVKALKVMLARSEPMMEIARKLADTPHGRFRLDWTKSAIAADYRHCIHSMSIAQAIAYEALLKAHEKDVARALRACRAAFNAARSTGDEPRFAATGYRVEAMERALWALERILAMFELTEEELREWQKLVQDESDQPLLLQTFRGERACWDRFFEAAQNGDVPLKTVYALAAPSPRFLDPDVSMKDRMTAMKVVLSIASVRARQLRQYNRLVEVAKLPAEEQHPALQNAIRQLRMEKEPLDNFVQGTASAATKLTRYQLECRSATAAIAAERFRLKHKRWPESLAELVPEYLDKVPKHVFDPSDLPYRRIDDGIVLGTLNVNREASVFFTSDGHGFRLWDSARRRASASPYVPPKVERPQ